MKITRIGALVSGALGLHVLKHLRTEYQVGFVLTDANSSEVLRYCDLYDIPRFVGNPRPRRDEVDLFLAQKPVDVIFSVGYLFLVESNIIQHPQFFAINLHGSLLPKYRGRTPHVWAIINGERETGVTAHLMTEECDAGNIVAQTRIAISDSMTGGDLLQIFFGKYVEIIDLVLDRARNGRIEFSEQEACKATFFGKRTPDDGLINWQWQKERLRNWVRAQAKPYPGAFTYYDGVKIIVDEILYDDLGYSNEMSNGLIVRLDPVPYVKTPNGVVKLVQTRIPEAVTFEVSKSFGYARS